MAEHEIAMVVPCFNEAQRLPQNYWKSLLDSDPSILWLFVDDGSSDTTFSVLAKLCEGTSALSIKLPENIGKGNAIRAGILHILRNNKKLKLIGYIDSDGAFSQVDFVKLTNIAREQEKMKIEKHFDTWISSRVALAGRHVHRKPSRHYLGRLISTVITKSWSDSPYDTQSGLKIFSVTEAFINAIERPFRTRWFIDIEIFSRIGMRKNGFIEIWEEPVNAWLDVKDSKISIKNSISILNEILYARIQVKKLLKARRAHGFN
jgi:glycosyltransferase involved in cell wall biosynthesis